MTHFFYYYFFFGGGFKFLEFRYFGGFFRIMNIIWGVNILWLFLVVTGKLEYLFRIISLCFYVKVKNRNIS